MAKERRKGWNVCSQWFFWWANSPCPPPPPPPHPPVTLLLNSLWSTGWTLANRSLGTHTDSSRPPPMAASCAQVSLTSELLPKLFWALSVFLEHWEINIINIIQTYKFHEAPCCLSVCLFVFLFFLFYLCFRHIRLSFAFSAAPLSSPMPFTFSSKPRTDTCWDLWKPLLSLEKAPWASQS